MNKFQRSISDNETRKKKIRNEQKIEKEVFLHFSEMNIIRKKIEAIWKKEEPTKERKPRNISFVFFPDTSKKIWNEREEKVP